LAFIVSVSFLRNKKSASPPQGSALLTELIGLLVILDEIAQGIAAKVRPAIIADLLEVIPHIAATEVHPAAIRGVFVLALSFPEQLHELGQADPLAAFAGAFAHLAGSVARVGLALPIGGFACGQVSLTITVWAAVKDMDF
jgi:hypothetical protein